MNYAPFRIIAVDHTGITVSNLERSVAFWRDVLGFELSHRPHQSGELASEITGVPGAEISIAVLKGYGHKIELLEYLTPSARKRIDIRPCDVGFVHVALAVDNLDAILNTIVASGWRAAGKPQTLTSGPNAGKRVIYVRDPDGTTIEFMQRAAEPAGWQFHDRASLKSGKSCLEKLVTFSTDEQFALTHDREDPLCHFRDRFHLPLGKNGQPLIYLAGNSLGLMPKAARNIVDRELDDWAALGVDAHLQGQTPWYSYHETLREPLARLAGAHPNEVVGMNSLTVNLHLMLATFYRPTNSRFKIVIEEPAFPSDSYALKSQIAHHGYDPVAGLLLVRPRQGEFVIRDEDFAAILERHRDELALVLLRGFNFFTGQLFDIASVTALAQKLSLTIGIDLAHAIGNVPLSLHNWNVDFAVWCSYKYLNAGPGAVAGAFVHERHATNAQLPRLAGWFGNDPNTRFRLHLEPEFIPVSSADGWQISNPPILAMAPLRASLAIFDEAGGVEALRQKSIKLTRYLEFLLTEPSSPRFTIITPPKENARGSQLSILVRENARELFELLQAREVKCDFREPNVIRVAPAPLYNTFHEVWRFAQILTGTNE